MICAQCSNRDISILNEEGAVVFSFIRTMRPWRKKYDVVDSQRQRILSVYSRPKFFNTEYILKRGKDTLGRCGTKSLFSRGVIEVCGLPKVTWSYGWKWKSSYPLMSELSEEIGTVTLLSGFKWGARVSLHEDFCIDAFIAAVAMIYRDFNSRG